MQRVLRGAAVAAAVGVSWALFEHRWFALRHQTVPALTAPGSTLRVLHLSDLHLRPGDDRMRRFIRGALRHGPDLAVVTGDILGHARAVDDAVGLLAEVVQGREGIAVLGSNDRFGPRLRNPLRYLRGPSRAPSGLRLDTDRLVVGLKEAGWHVLCNERAAVETPVGTIDVVGLDDPHIGAASPAQVDWTTPADGTPLRLGVVHSPYVDTLTRYTDADFDLVLAGHTHGGQIRVPGVGALVDNCDLPLRMARGLTRYTERTWLHVSAGLGTSMYTPVRFACRPEATVLDIVGRPPSTAPAARFEAVADGG